MIDKNVATDILQEALSTGGDFAELFIENNIMNSVSMINGIVEKAMSGVSFGCGIRIFDGYKAIYSYTNDISKYSLLAMAKGAAAVIKNRQNILEPLDFTNYEIKNKHVVKILPENVVKKDIVDFLRKASHASFAYDDLVTQTNNSFINNKQDVLIINSEGLWAKDRRVRTRAVISAVASFGNEKQTASFGPGGHMGFEFFDSIDIEHIGIQCGEIAVKMLKAQTCPGGCMPVIIDDGFGGVIFHEACGHGLEATSVAKGASVFTDKIGEMIASPLVTAIDDGTMPNQWGSQNIDDEGVKTKKNVLIENGILKSYLVDKLNGLKMDMMATGSGRRESYKFPPTSRMTNTYIASGKHKKHDIISNTEYGLYAKKMGGGSVSPATGEFNFAVTEGYIIKNGKIEKPVRGATLIGKGQEVLLGIDMVSENMVMEQGMCGSISGSIPTNVGQPMIRVKSLMVGGRA